jgi:2'-5' RNA ligase
MTLLRTFIALELENVRVKEEISRVQKELLSLGIEAKPVEQMNLHFTLRFLGEIEESVTKSVTSALSEIKCEPFKVVYRGLGAFPSISRINVVWVGVDETSSKNICSLWEKVELGLEKAGLGRGERFGPHLTILRVKSGLHRVELADALRKYSNTFFGEEQVSKLKFKRSVLTPKGPIYSDLHILDFGG